MSIYETMRQRTGDYLGAPLTDDQFKDQLVNSLENCHREIDWLRREGDRGARIARIWVGVALASMSLNAVFVALIVRFVL